MASSNPYTAPQAEVADVDGYHGVFQEMKIWGWRGRLGRLRFLAYGAVAYLVYLALVFVFALAVGFSGPGAAGSGLIGAIVWLLMIPYLVFWVTVLIRRSHDMGWSGWMSLLGLIPLVGSIWLFKAGSPGTNAHGAPPPPNGTGVKVAAFGVFGLIFVGGILAAIAIPAYQQYVLRAQAAKALQGK